MVGERRVLVRRTLDVHGGVLAGGPKEGNEGQWHGNGTVSART